MDLEPIKSWILYVGASEFAWGIIIGLMLSLFISVVTASLASRQRRRLVNAFCHDLIGSVCEYIDSLDENFDRNRVISHEFLDNMAAEIAVYSRNREHLVLVKDAQLRNDVRAFFTQVAARVAVIRMRLAQYYDLYRAYQNAPERDDLLKAARENLDEAHRACERLRKLGSMRDSFSRRLER